jgi:ATP-binding cassette subfamily C (CFTR/MRP) protein 1
MNDTFAACDDAAFGPIVHGCRGNFDFTVAFEFYFFSLLPLTIVLLAVPLRVFFLRRFRAKVVASRVKYLKLVG